MILFVYPLTKSPIILREDVNAIVGIVAKGNCSACEKGKLKCIERVHDNFNLTMTAFK